MDAKTKFKTYTSIKQSEEEVLKKAKVEGSSGFKDSSSRPPEEFVAAARKSRRISGSSGTRRHNRPARGASRKHKKP